MKEAFISTGNQFISIPEINEKDASIKSINFLHMGYKGLLEIRGGNEPGQELFRPFVTVDGQEAVKLILEWDYIDYWIPRFTAKTEDFILSGTILAPLGERGFACKLNITNIKNKSIDIRLGMQGCWQQSLHTINESKPVNGQKYLYRSGWNDSFVMDLRSEITIFSLAPIFSDTLKQSFEMIGNRIQYLLYREETLKGGMSCETVIYWGLGVEEVGATTSAKEMMRRGFEILLDDTSKWLAGRERCSENKQLEKLFNRNLFFNYFFASGITVDTEEFVLVTSRSPRYYVSAAYWDRDSLLWSFPSILITDAEYARNMLEYVYTKQIKNIGMHSRYIDGTLLEPGFELDELCAPIIALDNYIKYTGDRDILQETFISKGIKKILKILSTKKHSDFELYETFLQPTDDVIVHKYVTYDNVLVWKLFSCLSELLRGIECDEFCEMLKLKAELVKKAIWDYCVVRVNNTEIFAWSVNLQGDWNIYDEPPGSLQLLSFYGFCEGDNLVFRNTLEHIRRPEYRFSFHGCNIPEIGCEHAPHPWVLSIANSLLCESEERFMKILPHLKMDNGIACESVDETTGESTTGDAFATCAGFLAYALYKKFFKGNEI